MATVYKYRVFCTTEEKFQYVWGETEPTKCPENSTDTIDPSLTAIVGHVSTNETVIQEEKISTGEHFGVRTFTIDVAAGIGTNSYIDVSWRIPVSVLNVQFTSDESHQGDSWSITQLPNTTVGVIMAPVNIGDTTYTVSDTVVANVKLGYFLKLFDGSTMDEDLGYVTNVDKVNKTITTTEAASNTFSPLSPTYVLMELHGMEEFEIGPPTIMRLGLGKIGGSHLPANRSARITYHNRSAEAKKFIIIIEFLY